MRIKNELQTFSFRDMKIPEYMHRGITLYIDDGIEPGSFLAAVFMNNLSEAVNRADDENIGLLPTYIAFLHNHAPSDCWGSRQKYEKWMTDKRTRYMELHPKKEGS